MPRPALIIEDDPDIAESVRYNLETAGFSAQVASTGEQGFTGDGHTKSACGDRP